MIKSRLINLKNSIFNYSENHGFVFPIVLFIFAFVTYGVLIFSQGFYWDDWPPILLSHITDKAVIWKYFVFDRPFQSWTYYLLFPICRDSAFLWQLSAIFFRWTTALTLYYTFILVFPRQKIYLKWAAILFIVFPGFSDQYASVSFGSHFMVYTIFGLSLFFMVLSLLRPQKYWYFFSLSLFFTLVHLFSMEYFVGLEVTRGLILFFVIKQMTQEKKFVFRKFLLRWLPYFGVLIFYIFWRLKIYPQMTEFELSGSNYPYLILNFLKDPVNTLIVFIQTVYSDLRFLFIDIWVNRILPETLEIQSKTLWISIFIGLGITAFYQIIFLKPEKDEPGELTRAEFFRNLYLCLVIIFFGLIPIWSTLRQITIGKWSDRFDIPVIFGVSILVINLIFLFIRNANIRNLLLLIIIGLSIGYQIRIGNDFRKDFVSQKDFYTQLNWRVPSLKPGAMIYSPTTPFSKEADYSVSMGVNLLFNSNDITPELGYWFSTPRYFKPEELLADPNQSVTGGLRNLTFSGTANKTISLIKPVGGCLLILDPYYVLIPQKMDALDYTFTTGEIDQFLLYGSITNQSLIDDTIRPTNNLSKIVDTSPMENWCFYFEKADLAQSKGRMQEAVDLYTEALAKHLKTNQSYEYLPFIKAYASLGQVDEAIALTKQSFKMGSLSRPPICQLWHDLIADNPLINKYSIDEVYNSTNCYGLAK